MFHCWKCLTASLFKVDRQADSSGGEWALRIRNLLIYVITTSICFVKHAFYENYAGYIMSIVLQYVWILECDGVLIFCWEPVICVISTMVCSTTGNILKLPTSEMGSCWHPDKTMQLEIKVQQIIV